jgi:endonuclease YncB( thermonuclease family)
VRANKPRMPGFRRRYIPLGRRGLWSSIAIIAVLAVAAFVVTLLEPPIPPISGKARASDGDSLHLGDERVRLLGLDAPELDQTCLRAGSEWPCGHQARDLMTAILKRGPIVCEPDGHDRYGRVLARCSVAKKDIGTEMVAAGLAVATDDYFAEERGAKAAGKGIWSGDFELPADWRRGHNSEPAGFNLLDWLRSLI